MGMHVSRPTRGPAPIRSVSRPGDKARPKDPRLAASTKKGPKTGGTSGTKGDFGADFE
jgi:hypothetical protein